VKKLVVFTDLDGTLLGHRTYSFEPALPALRLLKERGIPLVICSSKTRREIEEYQCRLQSFHPFITENGGGIFIPAGYFNFRIEGAETHREGRYLMIRLGARYTDLRGAMSDLRRMGFKVKGFGDMSVDEVVRLTSLSQAEAQMALERDFDEPFVVEEGEENIERLTDAVVSMGFHVTRGRFFHILGESDKGKAMTILTGFYRREFGDVLTVALGDSPNDLPMLREADIPVAVMRPEGDYDSRLSLPHLVRAPGVGPEGWNAEVIRIVEALAEGDTGDTGSVLE
jgi:mannosyl-3-phosphoglycerate phosphatase family protein